MQFDYAYKCNMHDANHHKVARYNGFFYRVYRFQPHRFCWASFFIVLLCGFSAKFPQNVWIPMYGLPEVVPNHTNRVTYDLSCTWEEA